MNVAGSAEVAIALYDLRGGRISEVFRGPATSGHFQSFWDGRDQAGTLLYPGIYILRVEVDTDRGIQARERVVSLAY